MPQSLGLRCHCGLCLLYPLLGKGDIPLPALPAYTDRVPIDPRTEAALGMPGGVKSACLSFGIF